MAFKKENKVKKSNKTFADVKVLLKQRKASDFIISPDFSKGDK